MISRTILYGKHLSNGFLQLETKKNPKLKINHGNLEFSSKREGIIIGNSLFYSEYFSIKLSSQLYYMSRMLFALKEVYTKVLGLP